MLKKSLVKKIILIFVLISIVFLGFKVTNLQNQIEIYESDAAQVSTLLTGDSRVAGYSCGVLSSRDAVDLLKSSVTRSFQQGPTDKVREDKPAQELIFWSDSCRYVDSTNNSRYVEFYVTTFQSDEAAAEAFPDFLQPVNNAKEINAEPYGQSLIYDAGVYYLLTNNRIIQVAASNGSPKELESFSRDVFNKIIIN